MFLLRHRPESPSLVVGCHAECFLQGGGRSWSYATDKSNCFIAYIAVRGRPPPPTHLGFRIGVSLCSRNMRSTVSIVLVKTARHMSNSIWEQHRQLLRNASAFTKLLTFYFFCRLLCVPGHEIVSSSAGYRDQKPLGNRVSEQYKMWSIVCHGSPSRPRYGNTWHDWRHILPDQLARMCSPVSPHAKVKYFVNECSSDSH